MRLEDGRIIITSRGIDKGRTTSRDIGDIDIEGNICEPEFTPSIEASIHLNIYKTRHDVNAVCHAHPVTASAFSATSAKINCRLIIETGVVLEHIEYADFHYMGTDGLVDSVTRAIENSNGIIMKNHGVLTVGKTFIEALERIEALENAAQMTLIAEGLLKEKISPLTDRQVEN